MALRSRRSVMVVFVLAILLTAFMATPLQAALFQSPVTPTPETPTPVTPAPGPVCTGVYYTVQWGDNLYRIALRYGTSVSAIVTCNGLSSANRILAGQLLLIPGGTTPPPPPPPGGGVVYIVRSGDTLYSIANSYGTTVSAIAAANNISNVNLIYVGQRLFIPGSGTVTPPPSSDKYTVVSGDTVSGIAARFNVNMWSLISLNGLKSPYIIYPGQVLLIP